MKRVLLIIFVAASLCQGITAQDNIKIDVDLQQEMTLRKASELIRINIILNQQYDQMDMRVKSSVLLKKEDKRAFVVGELKRFSKETQRGVMDFLSTVPTVSEVRSFWIANFINCYADIETIEKLSLHPDVLLIGLDQEHQWIPEEKQSGGLLDEPNEITYNVLKVNANQVWDELGYTGENIIVAVLDTGVNYNHLDLNSHMWVHPDFPYHGWNIYGNNNNPMDDHGHGTHCAGTVASDGTAGTQAGVAPKALIMAIKIWSSGGSGTVSNCCDGFQFAIDHGAHLISLSGGFINAANASKILLRNTAVSVLETGTIAAVAAGNEGSSLTPPNSVRTPGNCPPPWLHPDQTTTGGISCVMSIGATDINDNIANFSSRGPVTWQSVSGYNDYPYSPGMGLIRPDVCAPGVNVKSCSYTNNSGYTFDSGTSMATPCVAGTIALMLSKNIDLTPAEIDEILETTAVHLPNQSSPKGNTYGSGRIDAYAAVQAVPCVPIYFTNQTVTTNTTVTSCDDIIVQNVTVTNGAKLTLDAAGTTTIGSNFEVQLGSQLEIKGAVNYQ
jgi:subtilisin family serine protease